MRNLISTFFHIAATVLAMIALVPAFVLIYWGMDRTLPLDRIAGRFVQWEDLDPPIAKVQWSGKRQRICLGNMTSWIFTDKVIDLPSVSLPPQGAVTPDRDGSVKWSQSVAIPHDAFGYGNDGIMLNVRFTWYCNQLQEKWWPLEVNVPPIVLPIPDHVW